MMQTISRQRVEIYGDSKKLSSEYDKVKSKTRAFAADARKQINSVGKAFSVAAVAGAGGLAVIYNDAAQAADQLAKLSDELGEAPERLSALQHAAELTGVSTGKMNSSLERMSRRLGEARKGTGSAVKALNDLNLNTQQFFNMSPADQFATIADRVNELGTQQEKSAAAAAIFGREGLALVNTLALGSDGLAAMEAEADRLGITLDRIELAKIEAANDSMLRARSVFTAFGNSLATELSPIVGALAEEFSDAAVEAGGFSEIVRSGVSKAATVIGIFGNALRSINLIWKGLTLITARYYEYVLAGMGQIETAVRYVLDLIPGVEVATDSVLKDISQSFKNTADEIQESMQDLAMEPIPSQKIKAWIDDVAEKAQKEAEQIAKNRQSNIIESFVDPGTLSNDPIDNSAAEQKERERLAKEQARAAAAVARQREREAEEQARLEESQRNTLATVEQFLMTEEERLALSYQRRAEIVQNSLDMGLISREAANQLELELAEKHEKQLAEISGQSAAIQLQNYSDLFGSMAGIAETFKGKQSGIYRALFAASKGFALAEAAIKIQQGLASAIAQPFPANIPAYASVASQAAGIIPAISGQSLAGQAHDGIDNVRETGSYYLQKGERVSTAETSAKQDAVLDRITSMLSTGGATGTANLTLGLNRAFLVEELSNDDDFDRLIKTKINEAA